MQPRMAIRKSSPGSLLVAPTSMHGMIMAAPLLLFAATNGHKAVVEMLLNGKADVNSGDGLGNTPLKAASAQNHKDIVEALLAHRADASVRDNYGMTPLFAAAAANGIEVARLLIADGADVNAKAYPAGLGLTPLHIAAASGSKDVAGLLLASKADPNARTSKGPGFLKQFFALLLSTGAITAAEARGTALGIHPTFLATEINGVTPLHIAAQNGRTDVAELLIANNAQINAKDGNGFTPFRCATKAGHQDTVDMLRNHGGR